MKWFIVGFVTQSGLSTLYRMVGLLSYQLDPEYAAPPSWWWNGHFNNLLGAILWGLLLCSIPFLFRVNHLLLQVIVRVGKLLGGSGWGIRGHL